MSDQYAYLRGGREHPHAGLVPPLSRAELEAADPLAVWNRNRPTEPRPAPPLHLDIAISTSQAQQMIDAEGARWQARFESRLAQAIEAEHEYLVGELLPELIAEIRAQVTAEIAEAVAQRGSGKGSIVELPHFLPAESRMTPLARDIKTDILIQARIAAIKRDALAGAKGEIVSLETISEKPAKSEFVPTVQIARPRPLLILPSNSSFARRLLAGLVCTRRNA
jgi:hypothetical protein